MRVSRTASLRSDSEKAFSERSWAGGSSTSMRKSEMRRVVLEQVTGD